MNQDQETENKSQTHQKSSPALQSWEQNTFSIILKIEINNLPQLSSSDIKLKMKKGSLSLKVANQGSFKIKHLYEEVVPKKTSSMRKGKKDILKQNFKVIF